MSVHLSHRGADAAAERPDSTRARLLEAAAELFAARGYAGTSIRAVTQAAGVSVSAANYHFGSKRVLLREAIERVLEPLNRERRAEIEAILRAPGPGPPGVEELLRAFLRPLFASPAGQRRRYRQIVNRLHTEPPGLVSELAEEVFAPLAGVMVDALVVALPRHSRSEISMAFQITLGVIIHFTGGHVDRAPGVDLSARPDDAELARRLPAFCAAGLVAYLEGEEAGR